MSFDSRPTLSGHASTRVLAKAGFIRNRFVPELERDEFRISAERWSEA